MSIQSDVNATPVMATASRRQRLRPFPEDARAQILEHSPDRLVLLLPAGPSRVSRSGGIGLIAMNAVYGGGIAFFISLGAAGVPGGLFFLSIAVVLVAAFSTLIFVIWLRLRFTEMWILIEPSRVAVKRTLLGRSRLKTLDALPDAVATLVSNQMARDDIKPGFNVRIGSGRKKIVFGTVLSLEEKQWICDEINRVLSGDDPLLSSVVLREGKFEFVPDEVAPGQARGNVRIDQSDAGVLAFEAIGKPRTALRRAGSLLTFVLSGLASLWLLANLFMRWWLPGMSFLWLCGFTVFPLLFAGMFCWTSAATLFVTTRIKIDRERLTRSRTGTFFGGTKSIPTSSVTEVVVRMRDDPRARRDGKSYLRLPDRGGADCLVRTASDSLQLSLVEETA
ncbi:MAG TPA: hypothetical protein VGP63_14470, partial [Planctomycetaceae bacterium]|nr:hypothetical protein [Planctomycetaceae bacterium]